MKETADRKSLFDSLHQQYFPMVMQMCLGYMKGDTELAKDMAQDVFINTWKALDGFKQQSSYKTWIYRITVNKSLDFLRKKSRKKRFDFLSSFFKDNGELKHELPHFDHPGILMEKKEKSAILFSAIDTLPENQKTAFILFHLEELSQKEIAAVMQVSPKAVESLVQRAKAGLRIKLEKIYEKRGI